MRFVISLLNDQEGDINNPNEYVKMFDVDTFQEFKNKIELMEKEEYFKNSTYKIMMEI